MNYMINNRDVIAKSIWEGKKDPMLADDFWEGMDKERFLHEPLYTKTQFSCLDNDIPYAPEHQAAIKAIDDFISNQTILNVIVALGDYPDAGYKWCKDSKEWIYVLPFPNDGLIAVIDEKSISIQKVEAELHFTEVIENAIR